jgi:hypothetical protein
MKQPAQYLIVKINLETGGIEEVRDDQGNSSVQYRHPVAAHNMGDILEVSSIVTVKTVQSPACRSVYCPVTRILHKIC